LDDPDDGLPIGHCESNSAIVALTTAFPHLHTETWGGAPMPNNGSKGWEQQLREAAARVEEDLRHVVTYINDEVVPDIRKNGSQALRAAAAELQKLAQRMDDRRAAASQSSAASPESGPQPGVKSEKDKP
jgi:hypothetical protein